METHCWEWLVVSKFQRGLPKLLGSKTPPRLNRQPIFPYVVSLFVLSSLFSNFMVRRIFSSHSPNGQTKDPTGRKRGMCIVCGGTPPPNQLSGAAAWVVGVVGPTVVGRPQTQETETSFLRVSTSPSENQRHKPPENWKEQHLNEDKKKTTTTTIVVVVVVFATDTSTAAETPPPRQLLQAYT